jgi:type III pantothenate kinase
LFHIIQGILATCLIFVSSKAEKMNLTIDQGNTFCKLAVFNQDELMDYVKVKNSKLDDLRKTIKSYSIDKAIISSVSEYASIKMLLEEMDIPLILLNHRSRLPIKINYGTPNTLGLDRIAAAVGAWKISTNTTNLIIDLGTCITYDIASLEEGFVGGNIAPGLDLRLTAMHEHTKNLPLLERKESNNKFGRNTNEAIQNGAELGVIAEIDSYINTGEQEYGKISTFLTGGDATYF